MTQWASRATPPRALGFTLLEVLVALAIVAVALGACLRVLGSMTDASEALRARTVAQWSADNQLALLRIGKAWPEPGTRRFPCPQGPLDLVCEQVVAPTRDPMVRRVEVSVYAAAGAPARLASLTRLIASEARSDY
ncbi:type II secretion system protein GspI (plasmid) [Cupriavidus sp. USMAA2-4]|uniref:type II secretion system minor pseudopilin GspI n=1 Tax=Cupriavidus sp. USMAA2-4 TaxID=876364 RepID=UPI0008A691FA|nr:type II secretion system minor pseudopilin GspI [Cupriavidus sp. USMAA2-4]AOY97547.1 type II secretion system protein GspI [Cupriavidus sp. USMAA2-4]